MAYICYSDRLYHMTESFVCPRCNNPSVEIPDPESVLLRRGFQLYSGNRSAAAGTTSSGAWHLEEEPAGISAVENPDSVSPFFSSMSPDSQSAGPASFQPAQEPFPNNDSNTSGAPQTFAPFFEQNEASGSFQYEPLEPMHPVEIPNVQNSQQRRTTRSRIPHRSRLNWSFREFLAWCGRHRISSRLFYLIIFAIIIGGVVFLWNNRMAVFHGIGGLISELLPLALLVWLIITALRNLIHPR